MIFIFEGEIHMKSSREDRWTNREVAMPDKHEHSFHFISKRLLDLLLATLLLVVFTPLMVFITIAIKLDTTGPVFFTQERVGARRRKKGGRMVWEIRTFRLYKFRSMVHNADQSVHEAYIKAFIEGQVGASE